MKKNQMFIIIMIGLILLIVVILFIGNYKQKQTEQSTKGEESMSGYTSISMEEARNAFKEDGTYLILDVRRADEFAAGHIPGAINIANEDIVEGIQTISAISEEVSAHSSETYDACEENSIMVEDVAKIVEDLNEATKEYSAQQE